MYTIMGKKLSTVILNGKFCCWDLGQVGKNISTIFRQICFQQTNNFVQESYLMQYGAFRLHFNWPLQIAFLESRTGLQGSL